MMAAQSSATDELRATGARSTVIAALVMVVLLIGGAKSAYKLWTPLVFPSGSEVSALNGPFINAIVEGVSRERPIELVP
jgi:hypothetical protein